MNSIVMKLKQPSTWQGLLIMAAAFGLNISPELSNSIVTVAATLVGFINVSQSN